MSSTSKEIIETKDSNYFVIRDNDIPCTNSDHWHTMVEFLLAVKDDCIFIVNEEKYILKKGEILLIWPTEVHSTVRIPKDGCLLLQFDSCMISSVKDFNSFYHVLRNIHDLNSFSQDLNADFRQTMEKIQRLRKENSPFAEPKIMILITEMLISLCSELETKKVSANTSTLSSYSFYVIKKACAYIDANCTQDISQKEVAEYCGFSVFHFSKLFHKFTGETFPEYLTLKRIATSAQLLQNKTLAISEVSAQSGFQSISNFNKLFKKHMGCTPLQYRKLYAQAASKNAEKENA